MSMRALMKVATSLLILAFVLIGVSYSMLRTYGSTSPTSAAGRALGGETRSLDGEVTTIDLSGPINLNVTQGAAVSLKVRGEQRSLGNLETVQDGDTLHIGAKGMLLNPRHRLQVDLVLPRLSELVVHSSGNTMVTGFTGERMELQLHGSGNITFNGRYRELSASSHGSGNMTLNTGSSGSVALELVGAGRIATSGSCTELTAELTGSGDLDARHLAAEQVTVELKGSGTTQVYAKRSADLTLRGSGDIRVFGNPDRRNVTRNGSGEVSWEQ